MLYEMRMIGFVATSFSHDVFHGDEGFVQRGLRFVDLYDVFMRDRGILRRCLRVMRIFCGNRLNVTCVYCHDFHSNEGLQRCGFEW